MRPERCPRHPAFASEEPIKLLQINSVYNTGSTGRIVEGIAAVARERGHRAWAAFGRKWQPGATETYQISNPVDYLAHGIYSLALDSHGLGSVGATKRFLRWMDDIQPDLVGLHNLHGYYLNLPLLFAFLRRSRIPIIWTLHDCWSFTGHCSYFDRFNCRKWQTECHDCPMTGYYPRSLVDRSTRNHRLKKEMLTGIERLVIVTPSEWLAAHVSASFLSDYPVHVIPNGIDLERFRIVGKRAREVIVLGVANRWGARKGFADFIKLRSKIPAEWRIVLVGLNPAEKRRLPENIEGLSRTESVEELVRLYSQATVYVNPTYADNFPTTNIEALACGTPVVTYRTGGSPEAITEGCGAVVEAGDIDGLAKAIKQYAAMEQGAVRAQCRDRAEREYSDVSRDGDYVELCEALVSGNS